MKRLLYRGGNYYMSDDINDLHGKTRLLKYIVNIDNMPHKHFANYIVVYGRQTCPYCIKTMELLKKKQKALFIDIDSEPLEFFGKTNLLKILKHELDGHDTVPIIFNKGTFIGGASEIEKII